MNEHNGPILPEDYAEPRCLLCGDPFGQQGEPLRPVPLQRIAEKTDEYMGRRDFAGAERHLKYWLAEAEQGRDVRGAFSLYNELMGFYRKTGNRDAAYAAAKEALALTEQIGAENIAAGTCCVNAGTVYDAFGEPQRSLPLFERARAIYERELAPDDGRLGGLYNNTALALAALRRFGEAYEMFQKALAVMEKTEHGEPERAITYLNMADAVTAEHGAEKAEEKVAQYLTLAEKLLNAPSLERNGYYAFVCEKCAPTFDYYGWFLTANELKKRAEEIYERA